MNLYRLLFCLIFTITTTNAFSKKEVISYVKGYVVEKETHDTIRGEISNFSKKSAPSYIHFKDSKGVVSKYKTKHIFGFYREDLDRFYLAVNSGVKSFWPKMVDGYYNCYIVTVQSIKTRSKKDASGMITSSRIISNTISDTYVIQHGYDEPISIKGFAWKKRLMKAFIDNKELHDKVAAQKTVVVKVVVQPDPDVPVSHTGHPMHATPDWIRLYNKWKAKQ